MTHGEVQELRTTVETLRDQLETFRADNDRLTKAFMERCTNNDQLRREVAALREQLAAAKMDVSASESRRDEAEAKLAASEHAYKLYVEYAEAKLAALREQLAAVRAIRGVIEAERDEAYVVARAAEARVAEARRIAFEEARDFLEGIWKCKSGNAEAGKKAADEACHVIHNRMMFWEARAEQAKTLLDEAMYWLGDASAYAQRDAREFDERARAFLASASPVVTPPEEPRGEGKP